MLRCELCRKTLSGFRLSEPRSAQIAVALRGRFAAPQGEDIEVFQ